MANTLRYDILLVDGVTNSFTITLSEGKGLYKITSDGSVTLTNNVSISASGTPIEGTQIFFQYSGDIDLDENYTFTVLGEIIGQGALIGESTFIANYTDGSWVVKVLPSAIDSLYNGVKTVTMDTGSTVTLNSMYNPNYIIISGSPTLAGNWQITGIATQVGDTFDIFYRATPDTSNGDYIVSIFGMSLTKEQAEAGYFNAKVTYNGTTWDTEGVNDSRAEGVIPPSSLTSQVNDFIIPVVVSFETDEQGPIWIPLLSDEVATSGKIHIYAVDYTVIKTIAGTDDADFNLSWSTLGIGFPASGPDVTNFPVTIIDSTVVGTGASVSVQEDSSDNYQYLVAEGTKTTAGGRIMVYIRCKKID